MRRKATLVVLGILFGACDFQTEQFVGDAALPPITVAFAQAEQLQDENSGTIQASVRLSRSSTEAVSVEYAVTGGTATIVEDFSAMGGRLEFAPGQTDLGIPVTIEFDTDETEVDETIVLTLSSPTGAELGTNTEHTITISSEVLPRVAFSTATSSAAETTNLVVMLTLDTAPTVESMVTFAAKAESTAAEEFDWTLPTMTTVTFPINTLTQMVTIPIMNDQVDEIDETVIIELTTSSNVVIGTVKEHAHTIEDNDDPPTVSITTADGSTTEGNTGTTNVNVTVTLSAPSGKTVTVPVTYAGGTATENADYTYTAKEMLVFTPNQNPAMSEITKMVTIQVAGDTTDEDNQTIITSLVDPPTNATLAMMDLIHTQTITDDDNPPSVRFMTGDQTVVEGDSGTTTTGYTLVLSAASEKPIEFDVDLTGTATIPMDYTTIPAQSAGTVRLAIAASMTTALLELVVVGDNISEGADETIIMDISNSNMMNVTRGNPRTRTHTIDDSDP